jgi:hypothetical protein
MATYVNDLRLKEISQQGTNRERGEPPPILV